MNYRVKRKLGKLRFRKCKALAKHGGRCKKRATSSGFYCHHHKHLAVENKKDFPPRLIVDKGQESRKEFDCGSPTSKVHDITPDDMVMSDVAVADIPIDSNSEIDAPLRATPELTSGPSDTSYGDISQGQDLSSGEGNGNVESSGRSDDQDDAAVAVAYQQRKPDLPHDLPEQEFETKSDRKSALNSTFNHNSGNSTNTNCGNTTNNNCGNSTTNNDASQNFHVEGVMAFITNNYSGFSIDDQTIKTLMRTAAAEMMNIVQTYNIPAGKEKAMVELALFDMVIVCDNSKSMLLYSDAMKKTLRHLVTISSLLLPKGITIRFLNTNHDGKDLYENITEGYQVDKICQNAKYFRFRNGPELGDFVNEDIIHPMIMRKARAGELKRPVITIMLTDADIPSAQGRETFKSCIRSCKKAADLQKYGDKAALFVLSRVGNSRRGKEFVSELETDTSINDMLHCSPDSLDKWLADCQKLGKENEYTGKLIELFLTALDRNGTA
ncbi:hypothetical protein BDQ94DRAFT_167814 [Aspergillus welwitschiae]|uniref:VWFA domain-containing protein n=1 Tax=Aspergillus welwitschiae TaxID=1341132 RepID=A0A3F3QAK8_9EURO|nr:hypothetical protein BDQ94DRAFT_167814 [Aspergillus welwitschiae]RDH36193.1 hypothetical protein BDQ94DRAFT_167814 [Aspergillus welwitschiae]